MLSVRDHMAIQFASATYKFPAVRATQVREQLGWSEPVFWRRINHLLDDPAALAAYPMDVRRLRRLRDLRRRSRRAS